MYKSCISIDNILICKQLEGLVNWEKEIDKYAFLFQKIRYVHFKTKDILYDVEPFSFLTGVSIPFWNKPNFRYRWLNGDIIWCERIRARNFDFDDADPHESQ